MMYSRWPLAVLGVVGTTDAFVAPTLPHLPLPHTITRIAVSFAEEAVRVNGDTHHSELTPGARGVPSEDLRTTAETGRAVPVAERAAHHVDEHAPGAPALAGNLPVLQLAAAGSLATVLGDTGMHPVDCVKTLQQSALGLDMSVAQAIDHLWTTAGAAGFYHGLLTYVLSDAVGGALKFAIWEAWKQMTEDWEHKTAALWMGAALAFVGSSMVTVPGEFLKQQLQMSYYENLGQAMSDVFATSGLAGFFVGYEGVFYRDIPYTMLELGLYEVLKSQISEFRAQSSTSPSSSTRGEGNADDERPIANWEEIVAGAITGGTAALLTTPLDTIKTKMMVDPDWGVGSSFVECLVSTVQQHGWQAVFAGVLARIAWIMPFTAMYLPLYDYFKRRLWLHHIMQQQLHTENQANAIESAAEKR